MPFWTKKKLTVIPDGDANFYTVVDGNQWIARVQVNGEYKLYTQRKLMEKIAESLAKFPFPPRS